MSKIELILGDNEKIIQKKRGYNIVITSPTYDIVLSNGEFADIQKYAHSQLKFLYNLWINAANDCQLFYVHTPSRKKEKRLNKMAYAHPVSWLQQSPWKIHQEIIWVRPFMPEDNPYEFNRADDRIYWLYKGKEPRKINGSLEHLTSVWPINYDEERDTKAYNFPQEISDRLLKAFYREGDVVLDPYMGGGTVGSSCKLIGADFIGIEINDQRYADAQSRLGVSE